MKPRQPSGLTRGIPFLIDANWSPEQALAVFELLDDLRDQIWQRYGQQIQDTLREQRQPNDTYRAKPADTDPELF